MNKLSRRTMIGIASLTVLATAACGGASAGSGGGDEPIVLGSLLTVTNPVWQNADVQATNKAWETYINEELKGINGRKVQIISCDDKGDGATATQCANNLLAQGAVAFVNNASLAFGNVVLPQTSAKKIASIGGNPITPQEYNSPFVFSTTPGASGSYPALAVYFRSTGAKKLGIVHTDTAGGKGVAKQLTELWTALGGEAAESFLWDPTAPDFTPLVSRVAAWKPDVVIEQASAGTAARLFKDMDAAGMKMPIGGTSAAAVKSVFDTAGPAVEGKYFSFACKPVSAGGDDVALYQKVMNKYAPGQELTNQTCMAASSLQYMIHVLKGISGDVTAESVLAQLNKKEPWEGFLTHDMKSDYIASVAPSLMNPWQTVSRYEGGKFVPVTVQNPDAIKNYFSELNGVPWFRGTVAGK
jgi:branched-chain amino acid transport system substrate-binding protein